MGMLTWKVQYLIAIEKSLDLNYAILLKKELFSGISVFPRNLLVFSAALILTVSLKEKKC